MYSMSSATSVESIADITPPPYATSHDRLLLAKSFPYSVRPSYPSDHAIWRSIQAQREEKLDASFSHHRVIGGDASTQQAQKGQRDYRDSFSVAENSSPYTGPTHKSFKGALKNPGRRSTSHCPPLGLPRPLVSVVFGHFLATSHQ